MSLTRLAQRSVVVALFAGLLTANCFACTTAVISGRATPDGRPLLWKNRDAPSRDNEVRLVTDGPFRCVAVVNAGDDGSVWMGMNEAGLCIENSLSRDLKGDAKPEGVGNGGFMLRVLKTCATVGDVELLLKETDATGRSTTSNFGVIDAAGGAVLFEAGPKSHRKFDANDPAVAPEGYVVRANFAFTAQDIESSAEADADSVLGIYSAARYLRGCRLMDGGLKAGGLTPRYLLRNCCRDLADADCRAVPGSVNAPEGELPDFVNTDATVSRATTVSAAVFQGVKPGEDPSLSTMWVLLGSPSFTVAVPCWVSCERVALELDGPEKSDLCSASLTLRDAEYLRDKKTMECDRLPEIWSAAWGVENGIFEEAEREIAAWRMKGSAGDTATELHERLARRAYEVLYELTKGVEPAGLEKPAGK